VSDGTLYMYVDCQITISEIRNASHYTTTVQPASRRAE
jgi:hypothetical protein